jgi:hypothetical protein
LHFLSVVPCHQFIYINIARDTINKTPDKKG